MTGDWDLSGSLGCSGPRTGIWTGEASALQINGRNV